jgi:hypothetical protein
MRWLEFLGMPLFHHLIHNYEQIRRRGANPYRALFAQKATRNEEYIS